MLFSHDLVGSKPQDLKTVIFQIEKRYARRTLARQAHTYSVIVFTIKVLLVSVQPSAGREPDSGAECCG